MPKTPAVIISYSWDGNAHKNWVRTLAERLVRNGVRVWLDQWHVRPGDSLTAFMEEKIAASGHVVVICTPNYARRSNRRQGGVGYEQQIISGRIAAGISRRKFIPVVRAGSLTPGARCALPTHFGGILAIDMRTSAQYRDNFEQLVRAIFNEPQYNPPALGRRRAGGRPRRQRASRLLRIRDGALRLPVMEIDGWKLDSGVVRNELHPDTFWIPPEHSRNTLKRGDLAKLPFDISVPPDEELGPISSERMWVRVHRREGPYYVGTLMNQPVCSDEQSAIRHGSRIVFMPENVIDIMTAAEARAEAEAERTRKRRKAASKNKKR